VPFEPPLLDSRIPLENPTQSGPAQLGCTYRTYLDCIHRFITHHTNVLSDIIADDGSCNSIQSVDIITEKHGSDYHPARIVVHGTDSVCSFVVNVAVTDRGKQRLKEDFRLLGHLRAKYGTAYIPREHVMGEQLASQDDGQCASMLMFLAEWFDGFHEFHLSASSGNEGPQLILWDLDRGYGTLRVEEASEVFRQVALILTFLYDSETFEEVFPWHHASGDFVVSRRHGSIEVRLITVRQYAARPVFEDASEDNRVLALLLFFANLSVRIRLDRLDGVGDLVWAGELSVSAAIQGFLDGMRQKVQAGHCDSELFAGLPNNMRSLSVAEWTGFFQAVLESYDPAAPDTQVVRTHLVDHIFQVYRSVRDILGPDR
jgi:hypothetical protein